jgi:hypothetical protein
MAKKYYTNKNGFQLIDFMVQKNKISEGVGSNGFTIEEGFLTLNAVKYAVRAGMKENETFEKDIGKFNDYVDALEACGYDREEVVKTINGYKQGFLEWNGTDEYIEELFKGGNWIA